MLPWVCCRLWPHSLLTGIGILNSLGDIETNMLRVLIMIIVPKTARGFHEILLDTTMR